MPFILWLLPWPLSDLVIMLQVSFSCPFSPQIFFVFSPLVFSSLIFSPPSLFSSLFSLYFLSSLSLSIFIFLSNTTHSLWASFGLEVAPNSLLEAKEIICFAEDQMWEEHIVTPSSLLCPSSCRSDVGFQLPFPLPILGGSHASSPWASVAMSHFCFIRRTPLHWVQNLVQSSAGVAPCHSF